MHKVYFTDAPMTMYKNSLFPLIVKSLFLLLRFWCGKLIFGFVSNIKNTSSSPAD